MGMCVLDNVHLLHNLPSYCKSSIVKSAGNAVFAILSLSLLETATSFNSSTRLFTSRVLGIVKESSYILRLLLPSELSPQGISYRELIMSSLLTPFPLTSAGPDSQLGCGLPTNSIPPVPTKCVHCSRSVGSPYILFYIESVHC